MTHLSTTADIASGEISIGEARAVVRQLLESFDREKAERLYVAFRAWTWKAVNARRRDGELRQWYDLFKRLVSFLRSDHPDLACKLSAFHELIYESVIVSEVLPVDEVVRRRHVREILSILGRRNDGSMRRAELLERLNLGQANLTRVLNMMLSARLLERKSFGRTVEFALSSDGLAAARTVDEGRLRLPSVVRPAAYGIASWNPPSGSKTVSVRVGTVAAHAASYGTIARGAAPNQYAFRTTLATSGHHVWGSVFDSETSATRTDYENRLRKIKMFLSVVTSERGVESRRDIVVQSPPYVQEGKRVAKDEFALAGFKYDKVEPHVNQLYLQGA